MRMRADVSSLDVLISELRTASHAPRTKRPAPFSDAQIDKEIRARLPLSDKEPLVRSARYRQQALDAARRNDIPAAEAALWRATLAVDRASVCRESWLTVRTVHEAAAAYVDYRAGRFDDAWRRTEDSLAATNELHETCGVPYMMPRRIHLVTNLVHMLARTGDSARAMALAWALFDYLEGADDRWPLPHLRAPRSPDDWDLATGEAMAEKLASEMALAMVRAPLDALVLLQEGRRHAQDIAPASCNTLARAHAWIRLKCWLADGDTESFLHGAARFLVDTAGPSSPLWRYVVHDASVCCNGIGEPVATQLGQELALLAREGPPSRMRAVS